MPIATPVATNTHNDEGPMAYGRYEQTLGFVAITGAFSTRSSTDWPFGDHKLSIGVQFDPDFVLAYRANPDDPQWAEVNPPHDPELTFTIPDKAAKVVVEIETHSQEPPRGDDNDWDYVEQGGNEFGHLPVTMQPLAMSSAAEHQRVAGPVLATIANGWNMVRVSCRDLRPVADETLVRFDIWPIASPTGHEVIRSSPRRPDAPIRDAGDDARGATIAAQTLQVPPPQTTSGPSHQEPAPAATPTPSPASGQPLFTAPEPLKEAALKYGSLLVRTDFADPAAWIELAHAAVAPDPVEGFTAGLALIDDPTWDGITVHGLLDAIGEPPPFYIFVADHESLTHAEHPILAISIGGTQYPTEHGQTVRVIPTAMSAIENNLSLGNMDFTEFVEAADSDGIFRTF
jgi:hypothetical protein